MFLVKLAEAVVRRWPATAPVSLWLSQRVRSAFPGLLPALPQAPVQIPEAMRMEVPQAVQVTDVLGETQVANLISSPCPPELSVLAKDQARFDALWPMLRADLEGLRDVAFHLTPSEGFRHNVRASPFAAPAVLRGRAIRQLLERTPRSVRHIVALPRLALHGGSERVSQALLRLLARHYRHGEFCVIGPEPGFDLSVEEQQRHPFPILAFNDIDSQLDADARAELFDRLLVQCRPATVHSVNSMAAWTAFRFRGAEYNADMRLFGNVYSDLRIPGNVPAGMFWQCMPDAVAHMAGLLVDNRRVAARAAEVHGFTQSQMARIHLVPTPVVGLRGDPRLELRGYTDPGIARSLWMGRVVWEKRLDVLEAIARRCSGREFHIHGDRDEKISLPVDMSWMQELSNVYRHGAFGHLDDLPFDDFDSYVFTTSAEGMPVAVLEAVAYGLPVVAPNVGGIGELIDASTGWLVSGPDAVDEYVVALDELRSHPREAQRRVQAAQERLAERHSWDSFVSSIHAIPGYLAPSIL